ncbi:MAG: hypothetical protein PSX37_02615 [bacterium]|nr:hypothetical protein [bacterium]
MIALNLIPAYVREATANTRRVHRWSKVLACLAATAAVAVGVALTRENPARDAWAGVTELESRIDTRKRELASFRAQSSALAKQMESADAVSNHPDWSAALAIIADRLGESLVLDSCNLNRPREVRLPAASPAAPAPRPAQVHLAYSIELGGIATTQAAVHRYLADLQSAGLFDSVTLIETRSRPLGDRTLVGFRLSCEIVAPADPAISTAR